MFVEVQYVYDSVETNTYINGALCWSVIKPIMPAYIHKLHAYIHTGMDACKHIHTYHIHTHKPTHEDDSVLAAASIATACQVSSFREGPWRLPTHCTAKLTLTSVLLELASTYKTRRARSEWSLFDKISCIREEIASLCNFLGLVVHALDIFSYA